MLIEIVDEFELPKSNETPIATIFKLVVCYNMRTPMVARHSLINEVNSFDFYIDGLNSLYDMPRPGKALIFELKSYAVCVMKHIILKRNGKEAIYRSVDLTRYMVSMIFGDELTGKMFEALENKGGLILVGRRRANADRDSE